MNPELVSTIASMRRSGLTDARIREVLLSTGWAEVEVADALKSMPLPTTQTFGEEPGRKPRNIAAAVMVLVIFGLIGAAIIYGAYIGW